MTERLGIHAGPMIRALTVALFPLGAAACGLFSGSGTPTPPDESRSPEASEVARTLDAALDSVAILEVAADPLPAPEPRSWALRTLDEMTVAEKAGQLIMPWVLGDFAPEGSASHDRVLTYIEESGIGGLVMSVGTPFEVAAKLNDLQRHSRIPLLVGADLETGAGFRMRGAIHMPGTIDLGGATDFPTLMAVGATGQERLAYEMGRITALEARSVGIHVPFAPVLDVNNNPDNPIINVRSFGGDATSVSKMGLAFIRGVQENGAIATGKHFPGHGDTEVDSHVALPVIRHDRARMDSVELRPFQDAIDAGMGAIMTAHISVPSLNGGITEPSTLSPLVLTNVLRDQMGFDGIIFTDAMDMNAISRQHDASEAAVRAIEAGADVILMPASVEEAIKGIVEAVQSGRISEVRLDRSVLRMLESKEGLGLHEDRLVPIEAIPQQVGIPAHIAVADRIAQSSITLLKNDGELIPLAGTRTARVMSVSYRRTSDVLAGRFFNGVLRGTYPRLTTVELDVETSDEAYASVLRGARDNALVVVSTYVTAVSYSGSVAVPDELVDFIEQLRRIGVPHVVVSFGNPYLISAFPDVRAYMLAWNGSEASQRAAAKALLGQAEIVGRSPTQIPPLFEIGAGLMIPRKVQAAGGR
ncbi:MAG: glycoside hydrolase family 3 C-terminal domain-containing protein [Gemmatimonadetes bacterium]|nr:glycoside hydrolase family 3 C-terminal domain-containing protein [Gemmatimonadota bacterium]